MPPQPQRQQSGWPPGRSPTCPCTAPLCLLLQPAPPPGQPLLHYLVGHAAFVPFSDVREDGSVATVAVGVHRYMLKPPTPLLLRDQPPLNWRAMLGDMMSQEIPEPLLEFQLFETGP